uniref:5-hydroxytryptamine receptor 3B n=1 Tax=Sphenodon punctatus TaxID=8508 RepID=A0A8D0L717_SPHPU
MEPAQHSGGSLTGLITHLCFCLLGSLATDAQRLRNSTLHKLTRRLLRNYSKGVRPVRNWTEATTVYLDLFVHAVLDVDAQNQKLTTSICYREIWKDEFLTWNSSGYDGIQEVSLPHSSIWAPDIIISEFMDIGKSPDLPYVYVNSSGRIKHYKPMQVVSACNLEMYAFPFDTQNCSLTFSSILHKVEDMTLAFSRSYKEINEDHRLFLDNGEWELLSVPSEHRVLHTQTGDFTQIQFHVVIRRRPLLYVVSVLIPSLFLMVVDLGSFYLPPSSGTRITFKTSILVGYTVFKVNMSDKLPGSTGSTPLIGVFFTTCMALLVLSLSKSILLIKFLHLGEDQVRESLFASCCGVGSENTGGNSQPAQSIMKPVRDIAGTRRSRFPDAVLKTAWSSFQNRTPTVHVRLKCARSVHSHQPGSARCFKLPDAATAAVRFKRTSELALSVRTRG